MAILLSGSNLGQILRLQRTRERSLISELQMNLAKVNKNMKFINITPHGLDIIHKIMSNLIMSDLCIVGCALSIVLEVVALKILNLTEVKGSGIFM